MNVPSIEDMYSLLNRSGTCNDCGTDVDPGGYCITRRGDNPLSIVCNKCSQEERERAEKAMDRVFIGIVLFVVVVVTAFIL